MTQTLCMQHPFLTGKLQPFRMHGNSPIKTNASMLPHKIPCPRQKMHSGIEFAKYNIDYQLLAPAEQRVNASEQAICTSKTILMQYFTWLISCHISEALPLKHFKCDPS